MKISFSFVAIASAMLLFAPAVLADFRYGLPWGTDNRWANQLNLKHMSWYHHWQDGYVKELHKLEYVPTFWGPTKMLQWMARKEEISRLNIENILAFNEPDIKGQANLDPDTAVSLFMQELQPYALRGINVSSPQMVYDAEWLARFMNKCQQAGCKISFLALHWYGGKNDLPAFKNWIQSNYQKYKLPIWVTEYGLNASSEPSNEDVNEFLQESIAWMKTQPYIQRVAWNGCFDLLSPPDSFLAPTNAFFVKNGGGTSLLSNTWLSGTANILVSHPHLKIVNNTRPASGSKSKVHRRKLLN